MLRLLFLITLPIILIAQAPRIKIGLDSSSTEWIVSCEDGGTIFGLQNQIIKKMDKGERIRIWWDSKSRATVIEEFFIQVGGPVSQADAVLIIDQLKKQEYDAAQVSIPDSNFFRILIGKYPTSSLAESAFQKLTQLGYAELWISSDKTINKLRPAGALFLITERYDRIPVPNDGLLIESNGTGINVQNKGRYAGTISFIPNLNDRITVVNTVDLEAYLQGVVPKEMGPTEFPNLEALKAQAVAARTYAIANLGKRKSEGFDLNDTISDQVYGGLDAEHPLSTQAISETSGMIATYDGQPIQALFMANAGGATVDVSYVFGGNAPYLKGVSTYSASSPILSFSTENSQGLENTILNPSTFRLLAYKIINLSDLSPATLQLEASLIKVNEVLGQIQDRLALPIKKIEKEINLITLAQALSFDKIGAFHNRSLDSEYIFNASLPSEQRGVGYILLQRSLFPYSEIISTQPLNWGQALKGLGVLWNELQPLNLEEGVLLGNGEIQRKRKDNIKISLELQPLLFRELPGGEFQIVPNLQVPLGDRIKWLSSDRDNMWIAMIHRLDPDGISLERFHPFSHWKQEYSELELLTLIRKRTPIKAISSVELTYNNDGRVTAMALRDNEGRIHRYTGMRIRGLFSLKDNVFNLISVGKGDQRRWIFYGRGWGHGVGLSQTATYGMALEGKTYEEILKHFYRGIELEKKY